MRQLLRFNILTWPRMSKFLSRIVWTIHGRVLQEWTRCVFYNCLYSLCRPCFLVSLASLVGIQQFCPLFGLHVYIVEEYVLLSALLHDQSCLQSSPCFQHQFVWLPFFSNPCLQGWVVLFMYMGARESCLRACATLLCHARVKTIGTSLCLTSSSLLVSATITERSLSTDSLS